MDIFINPVLYIQAFREVTGRIFDAFFLSSSFYGEISTAIVIIAIIYWCFDKKLGEFLFLSLFSGLFVNTFIKLTACIYRPWIMDARVEPLEEAIGPSTGYSFPSGHTTIATALFGGIAYKKNFSLALKTVLFICIAIIAFSRIYVGVHTVPDLIAAFILTLIILFFISRLYALLEERPNLDIAIASCGIVLCCILMFYAMTKSYPMDVDAAGRLLVDPAIASLDTFTLSGIITGFLVSWVGERRLINFSTDGTAESKILRLVSGVIIIGFLIRVILPIGGHDQIIRFISGFIILLFAVFIYPAVIKFLQNRKMSE